MKNKLLIKINDNSATIAIIELGYVGLPLVIRFVEQLKSLALILIVQNVVH